MRANRRPCVARVWTRQGEPLIVDVIPSKPARELPPGTPTLCETKHVERMAPALVVQVDAPLLIRLRLKATSVQCL